MILQQHTQLVDLLLLQKKMRELADTDPLTGLLNRRALDERLDALITAAGPDTRFSVALLDLNGFKPINDRHGHAAGDQLLCGVAERLRHGAGETAAVARLGGDEFAILIPPGAALSAATLADHLLAVMVPPHLIAGHSLSVGGSIGVAVWPVDGYDRDTLFDVADRALYAAKAKSRASVAKQGSDDDRRHVAA